MSSVVRVSEGSEQAHHGQIVAWFCPACCEIHSVCTQDSLRPGTWTWNGDMKRPTISPGVLRFDAHSACGISEGLAKICCHCIIRDGRIEFYADSPHALAGQTVEMLPVEEWPQ